MMILHRLRFDLEANYFQSSCRMDAISFIALISYSRACDIRWSDGEGLQRFWRRNSKRDSCVGATAAICICLRRAYDGYGQILVVTKYTSLV